MIVDVFNETVPKYAIATDVQNCDPSVVKCPPTTTRPKYVGFTRDVGLVGKF